MTVPQGTFRLLRHPERRRETLRAWDAADELLLRHLAGDGVGADLGMAPIDLTGPTVVLNDSHGALGVALGSSSPTVVADSYCARTALEKNLERNGRPASKVRCVTSADELTGRIATLVLRPPRSNALLEHQLRTVAPLLDHESVIVGAEMTKHLHAGALQVMERVIGPTTTSRAHRRARLISCRRSSTEDPGPWEPWTTFEVDPDGVRVHSLPGVFSAGRLDRGTALLLEHLPPSSGPQRIVDLGCGNGVVGVVAASRNPEAEISFVDDSALAVASAQRTFVEAFGPRRHARFVNGSSLADRPPGTPSPSGFETGSIDVVLVNPPFHDDHAVGDAAAWQMFADSHRALRPGGELWCVGNRHLAYHAKLARRFGSCDVVASNPKFVVLRAVRR